MYRAILCLALASASFTVLALKGLIGPKLSPPATEDQQKLVFRGRILKDTDTLEACGA